MSVLHASCAVSIVLVTATLPGCHSSGGSDSSEPMQDTVHHRHTNRLAAETSPYLLQHAHNPVEWYPWGDEAFAKAKAENKLVLVSIGYSSCHWCHVMERESFENDSIAALMNERFVCIKVDREERPDVDHVYQSSAQIMGVSGGWPLTVFLTPEGKPFYVGTYFPPADNYGRPGFVRLLRSLAEIYHGDSERVRQSSEQLTVALSSLAPAAGEGSGVALDWPAVAKKLWSDFDTHEGGFGSAPKFPHSTAYELLSHIDTQFESVFFGLRKMAQGGIFDHVGGGFHRYSTDSKWLVPHFEKMSYDNALIPRAYITALLMPKHDSQFENTVNLTLEYVLREMTDPSGAFYASQDADSEGEEGKFFVWSQSEFSELCQELGAPGLPEAFGVTAAGNFEGANILHLPKGWLDEPHEQLWRRVRPRLLERRLKRPAPGRDEKISVAWNGMMIATFVQAALVLGNKSYLAAARKSFVAVTGTMKDRRRLPSVVYGNQPKHAGLLDDYAFMIEAATMLYQATSEVDYLETAKHWLDTVVDEFWDEEAGFFRMRSSKQGDPGLPATVKPIQTYDGATPSGNAVMYGNLFLFQTLLQDAAIAAKLARMRGQIQALCARAPSAFTVWLKAFWWQDHGFDIAHVVEGERVSYSFENACHIVNARGLHDAFLLWGKSESDLELVHRIYRDQFTFFHKKGQSGLLLCSVDGCKPLVTDIEKL
jgi:uncharacterized protein YyaL (SSP411 family)